MSYSNSSANRFIIWNRYAQVKPFHKCVTVKVHWAMDRYIGHATATKGIDKKCLSLASVIFSLGITHYELVNMQLPFHYAQSKEELFKCIKNKLLPKISALDTVDFPKEHHMMEVIQKGASKHSRQRFTSCLEFKKSLAPFINE
jgi:hypothetical protein